MLFFSMKEAIVFNSKNKKAEDKRAKTHSFLG